MLRSPHTLLLLACSLLACSAAAAQPHPPVAERVADLRGPWLFQLGDDPAFAALHLDDSDWDRVFAPSAWEDEGFWGYDGFAWYRKHVRLPESLARQSLVLDLGRIDDVDEVFVNGHFVGASGRMPEMAYETSYHTTRRYRVPAEYLRPGPNVIAVRVFDERLEGGILEGALGLYRLPPSPLAVDLAGRWQFRTGDDPRWRQPKLDGRGWEDITVPGRWEPQGYRRHNGFAWYRKQFFAPAHLDGRELVLVLGRIDDLDEVFVNGHRIGGTGNIERRHIRGNEWRVQRRYTIPPGMLRFGAYNVIAVRVYDGLLDGGIYEGPVGLAEAEAFVHREEDPWDRLLRFLRNLD